MKTFSRARVGSLHWLRALSGRSRALSPALEWDFVDMGRLPGLRGVLAPVDQAPARELRRCSEGGRKAVGRRKRSTEGGRKVLWSASWPSRTQRTRRELLQSGLGRPPEGGWKALERYRRRSEGGRLRPFDHLIGGNCMNNFERSLRNLLASFPFGALFAPRLGAGGVSRPPGEQQAEQLHRLVNASQAALDGVVFAVNHAAC